METGIPTVPIFLSPSIGLQDILQWASVIPYPSIIVIPVAISNFLNNSLGIGADPHRAKRSDETSAFTGLCISSAAAVGTKVMNAGFHLSTKLVKHDGSRKELVECKTGEIGEICVSGPGVLAGETYTDPEKNKELYFQEKFLKTGDLGFLDEDGYLKITGRAKDLIIRGGHNIDPAIAEEALASHPSVAMVGVIGQPDARLGEMPCAYVELIKGSEISIEDLTKHVENNIGEKAAIPKHYDIVEEMPKTPIGKIFKPELRKRAIKRVYNEALEKSTLSARVQEVIDHPNKGLTAVVAKNGVNDAKQIGKVLDKFIFSWE